jgi:3-hydroxyacyl-CoA dehydrogenase/enoyl-CoA hydratase/3-hydroxybutyryl-CoA epimerase/3-hydroxyacyl-CoA dehydrogenase/enoyl-CoA hydratase/3-hydroxybutyryl-CoA epimerase/enoyl-CoA isomerase
MSEGAALTLSWPEADIALITFDLPGKGANILSRSVLEELAAHLDALDERENVAGLIIISGKPGTFIAGADLREFAAALDAPKEEIIAASTQGQEIFARLSAGRYVTVAAVDGICVGGGAELAVWCDRRVLSDNPKTELGFPEVKLGLFPGWGGTARTPRLVGLANAVELICGGESLDASAARAMGLASDVVPADQLLAAATRMVRTEQQTGDYLRDRERSRLPIVMNETELGFLGLTNSAYIGQQTKGQYPAPLAALELLLETSQLDLEAACRKESQGFAQLFGTPINRALINVFFLTDRNKRDTGLAPGAAAEPRALNSVAVIGAGIMGAGIAEASLKRKLAVTLTDARQDALLHGARSVMEGVSYSKQKRGPDVQRAIEFAPLLNATAADSEVAACDLIIEAVVENIDVKRDVYQRLEPQLQETAILASNTSTIPITRLAEKLVRPEQFCGIHFFNPVRKMQLVEVIRGKKTSDATIATAVAYAKRIGKMPIVVNDGPGFLVNRLLLPYLNESLELLLEGATIESIERAAKKFGMPLGPVALFDMVGIDTAMYAGRVMWEAFPDRIVASPILPALVKAGMLGQKTGSGFFSYQGKKGRAEPNPKLREIIDRYKRAPQEFTPEQLTARLFLPILLEATRILDDKIVRDVRDIDLGLIFGLGFPPFKGGLLFWADTLGAAKVVEMLKPLEHLGARTKPTARLLEMAKTGAKFYDQPAV